MATLKTTARVFFQNGASANSNLVGYISGVSYVVRYTFSTDDIQAGASSIRVDVPASPTTSNDWGLVGSLPTLRFKVTTSATSHVGAGPSTADYDGVVSFVSYGGTYYLSIPTTNIVLLPGSTYYLYVFAGSTAGGYFYNRQTLIELETSGGAGIVLIYNGKTWDTYQCYIYTGSKWELFLPYIYTGSAWALY